jgi:alpha-beta hydrolase superfamily lysophospholipase
LFIFGRKWNVDILGNDFKYTTIEQPDDYSGKVISTIIKKEPIIKGDRAILYIHGYNDYFFQKEMADTFTAHGYNFYAIDLRKYGRSILKDQTKFEARSLDEYFQDIDSSLYILKEEGISNVILMGHSTGGLISSYYLSSKKDQEGIIKA